jgi:glycosyltransferase involved in cell wall biosynthesis
MNTEATTKSRLMIIARTRYALPLDASLERKFRPLSERLELRVLGTAVRDHKGRDERFRLYTPTRPTFLEGLVFHLALPFRTARELRRFQPDVVLVQGAHEAVGVLFARAIAHVPAKVVLDMHGDWRVVTRLYGSPLRRLLNPLADLLARIALRKVDGIRTVGPYTTSLVQAFGRAPIAEFPAFMDLDPFLAPAPPLPEHRRALFVGVLEPNKAIDVLSEAWRVVAPSFPDAQLHIVGSGSQAHLVEEIARDLPQQVSWASALSTAQVADALGEASFLVLPSRSEGMGRVVIEALCRNRPVIGSRVGGIPDLVEHGHNGLLVKPGSADALAEALRTLLADRALLEQLAANARASAEPWVLTPEQFATRMAELVERTR